MSTPKWVVTFQIYRKKGNADPHFDEFKLEVSPDEYVLDGIERVWAFHDRSLAFRHACHHSTCGACGMRVNGAEKLTCITLIRDVTQDGGVLRIEPMRNFPVVSDLAVDMGILYTRMEMVEHQPVNSDAKEAIQPEARPAGPVGEEEDYIRLSDCIECGLCISACPISGSSPEYLGPAVLAGAHQHGIKGNEQLLKLVDSEDGVWRCHSAFECTAVCPSFVEPGWRIMDLRKQVIGERFKRLFRGSSPKIIDTMEASK
ncbi:MAG: 2Fe-2S iron-sulfur cluster-binding protein [Chloroflexi bacterium]|nr:2Fe-2S iron-sulfur cluster-binding protein [Chloroflexota bacterium]